MPDFDIDFCQNRRDEVIHYVQEKYGADHVAQIITFGTLQARACLRDVGRVLQMPYGQVDRIAKMIPFNPAAPVSLEKAVADEPRLQAMREEEPVVDRLLTIANKLEGLYRHASTHAAGIVIGDRPLDQLVPLYRDPRSGMQVTQFNMKWVENAGLVKFDFLGLKTLTVLDIAARMVRERGIDLDLLRIPLDDQKTFDMLTRGETVGVFQVESAGMRRALVDMRPDRFEDLIALVALYRPGPMANIPSYCARKLGKERVEYLHPKLESILAPTYGIITYQEQVQQIARVLAGYSLAEADLLRRAMGKKIKAEMDAQRGRFLEGATERGVDRGLANTIFDACAKFAEYGFNKSHSAPYAFITYQTAYLKANYPAEFMAASMTLDTGNTDKVAEFRREAIRLGHSGRSAVGQPLRRRIRCRGRPHPLFALRDQGRRGAGGRTSGRGAGQRPVHATSPISPAASIRSCSTSARWKAWSPPAHSTRSSRIAPGSMPASTGSWASRPGGRTAPRSARPNCSAGRGRGRTDRPAGGRAVACRPRSSSASTTRSASIFPPIRSTNMPGSGADAGAGLGGVRRVGSPRRDGRPARRHGDREAGAPHAHRQPHGRGATLRSERILRGGDLLREPRRVPGALSSRADRWWCWSAPRSGRKGSTFRSNPLNRLINSFPA